MAETVSVGAFAFLECVFAGVFLARWVRAAEGKGRAGVLGVA